VSKRKNTINRRKNLDQANTESPNIPSQEAVAVVEVTPLPVAGSSSSEQVPIAETIIDEAEEAGVEGTEQGEEPVAGVEEVQEQAQPSERREIVKSASLVMLGNLGSSLLGMARQIVVAGAGAAVSGPFTAALAPAQKFNDFLINGSISGALIPTFNDYAAPEKREELRRIVFTIVNLILLITIVSSIAFLFLAPWLFNTFLTSGYTAADKELTIRYAQIIFFSLMGLGPFAVLLSALYALKEFGWPAFATASYHLGIIIGAAVGSLIGGHFFGAYGIAFGVLLGVGGEIALLIPGMSNQHFRYKFVLDLKHPALRRILMLYAPIAFSYLVTSALAFFDLHLATVAPCAMWVQGLKDCGTSDVSAMSFATTLIQFPQGLVGAALSFAVLPTLTAHAREGQMERFKDTLLLGFRLGLLLMIPAAAGLIILRTPIISVIFEHHNFVPQQVTLTALALQYYAYQLPFIAIDQLLIAAFYARKNTIIPVVIGVVSILGYLAVALPFWQTWGMPTLALANTVQNALHAVILLVLLRMAIGSLHVRKMLPTVAKILLATALMVGVTWGLLTLLEQVKVLSTGFIGQLAILVVAGGLGAAVYFGGVLVLKVEEVRLLKGAVLAKLGKK